MNMKKLRWQPSKLVLAVVLSAIAFTAQASGYGAPPPTAGYGGYHAPPPAGYGAYRYPAAAGYGYQGPAAGQADRQLPAPTTPAAPGNATARIDISGMRFSPATLTIEAGDTVTWSKRT